MAKRNVKNEKKRDLNTDAEYRKLTFKKLLQHIRGGYSIDCFTTMSAEKIELFLNQYPLEFIREELDEAIRDAKQGWEEIGRKQSNGTCLGNSRSWYYNMSNRYGWSERAQVKQEHTGSIKVDVVNYADTRSSSSNVE